MAIKFITGNKNKFSEVQAILAPLETEMVNFDLPEIQELDPHEVLKKKLEEALKHTKGPCLVEDQGLLLECLGSGLPGPLIKWFEKSLGNEGLANLTQKLGNDKARAYALLGFADDAGNARFFEGSVSGKLVPARGDLDFGWGPIFQPDGSDKTFGEMSREEKHSISMRGIATRKLKNFLLSATI